MPPIRFCSACGAAVKTVVPRGDGRPRQVCPACGTVHYVNSKPTTGALITRGRGVLLVRRGVEPYRGQWDVPGGFLEEGEHPEEGLVREIREELGVVVRPGPLLGVVMDQYGRGGPATLNLYYLARIVRGTPSPRDDAVECRWFEPEDLPRRVAFRCNREALRLWRQWLAARGRR